MGRVLDQRPAMRGGHGGHGAGGAAIAGEDTRRTTAPLQANAVQKASNGDAASRTSC